MISVAVNTFVMEPIWNTASGVTGTCVSRLVTPAAAVATTRLPFNTASDAPGTLWRRIERFRRDSRSA